MRGVPERSDSGYGWCGNNLEHFNVVWQCIDSCHFFPSSIHEIDIPEGEHKFISTRNRNTQKRSVFVFFFFLPTKIMFMLPDLVLVYLHFPFYNANKYYALITNIWIIEASESAADLALSYPPILWTISPLILRVVRARHWLGDLSPSAFV